MFARIIHLFRHRPAAPAALGGNRTAFGDGAPEAVAHGIGGRIVLFRDRIEIHRSGFLVSLIDMLLHVEREIETTIFLEDLAAAHVIRSLLMVEYLRFSYPGSPQPTGRYLRDAFAENALMLRWTDNRAAGRLILRMYELRAQRINGVRKAPAPRAPRNNEASPKPPPAAPRKTRSRA